MARIPVTQQIPGASGLGGGLGLEHTREMLIPQAQVATLRATPQLLIPAPSGQWAVVKYVIFRAENAGPSYTAPTGTVNLRVYYGTRTSDPILDRVTGFLVSTSSHAAHIEYADEVQVQSSGEAVNLALNGGSGEFGTDSANGGLVVRIVYDLIDLPS